MNLKRTVFEFEGVTYKDVKGKKIIENKNYEIEQDGNRIEIWFKETFDRDSGYFHYLGLSDVLIINGEVITNLEDFCSKLVTESNLW